MRAIHNEYIAIALELAKKAAMKGEVPVGALVVLNDEIIGKGHNQVEELADPTAHAEMAAMKNACAKIGEKYLKNSVLYSTLEPCIMCTAAAVHRKIGKIVFGASDIRWGGCGTIYNVAQNCRLNHNIEVIGGIMEIECQGVLKDFFRRKR